eukprot:6036266-Ditylum_brightwellii.AAC.1
MKNVLIAILIGVVLIVLMVILVDDDKEDVLNNSVDGGDKHLTHLTQAVGCCLKARSEQNMYVDDNKEDGVYNSVDGGVKHIKYLLQFKTLIILGGGLKDDRQCIVNV